MLAHKVRERHVRRATARSSDVRLASTLDLAHVGSPCLSLTVGDISLLAPSQPPGPGKREKRSPRKGQGKAVHELSIGLSQPFLSTSFSLSAWSPRLQKEAETSDARGTRGPKEKRKTGPFVPAASPFPLSS